MPTDLIRYDLLVQDALKGVVRDVLSEAARDGLPGEHHFCITFRTHSPGVKLAPRIREKHPDEMTIILQHQFWDLVVTEQAFEVGLSFGSVPERLVVPFEAVTRFWDPSVQFGLKFEMQEDQTEAGANDAELAPPDEKSLAEAQPEARPAAPKDAKHQEKGRPASRTEELAAASDAAPLAEAPAAAASDKIVSIDAFRKKT